MNLNLTVLDKTFTIYRFEPSAEIPAQVMGAPFVSISRTEEELSIVCPSTVPLQADKSEFGWAGIKVLGPLDFSLIGILAEIATALAGVGISIFVISTFDTDYILLKADNLQSAQKVLEDAGCRFLS